jgi:MFS family permease
MTLDHAAAGRLGGLALVGIGLGAFTPANNAAIMSSAPIGHAGVLSGLLNMTRGVGTALGVALTGMIYTTVVGVTTPNIAHTNPTSAGAGLTLSLATLSLLSLSAGLGLLLTRRLHASARRRQTAERAPSHVQLTREAIHDGVA